MNTQKLVAGLALLLVGVLTLTDAWDGLRRYWPVIPLALGAIGEAQALRARKGDGSILLLAFGAWTLAASQQFLGLTYVTAWPIGVVVAGLGMVVHAVIDRAEEKENHHESC